MFGSVAHTVAPQSTTVWTQWEATFLAELINFCVGVVRTHPGRSTWNLIDGNSNVALRDAIRRMYLCIARFAKIRGISLAVK